ncbi:MAG: bifunctional metallophosphatase/5'-nucleotidase [Urechidicola sp.]|nr:bifunctional metallophosphatase/5'-nucleotidase [Urechidicola sp.]
MKKLALLFVILFLFSCSKNEDTLEFIVINVNDIYEIDALGGGKVGGLARVATLYDSIKKENKNTLLVHGGDFLNPSLLGTIKDEKGERYSGKQMVEVMNAVGFDLVAFGNHEFDLKYSDFQKRLNESEFQWIATNIKLKSGDKLEPFYVEKEGVKKTIPKTVTFNFKDDDGTEITVGFLSSTINSTPNDYVDYGDLYQDPINLNKALQSKVDLVLGLTHVTIAQDKMLANSMPNIPIIFGGHEHTNMMVPVGDVVISKADANARTAYVHKITFNKSTKKTTIQSELVKLNESIAPSKKVERIVQRWNVLLDKKLKLILDDPYEVVFNAKSPLDGRDTETRSIQTNLGQLIAASMSTNFDDEVDCAFLNGGSIRIDDELLGDITGVDIFRVLPFGGEINKVEMTGLLLEKTLNFGRLKAGTGAYLQRHNIDYNSENKTWVVGGKPIISDKVYTVVLTDYLLLGLDIPFLKANSEGMLKVYDNKPEDAASDIRKVVINYLEEL